MASRLACWGWLATTMLLLGTSSTLALNQEETTGKKATILIKVSPDAKVAIDGAATKMTGAERTFTTPDLDKGTYRYTFVATWMQDGKEQRVERVVRFKAGDTVTVDMTDKAAAKAKSRTFDFTYAARVKDVPVGKTVKIWIPVAQSNADQDVSGPSVGMLGSSPKGRIKAGVESGYGNRMYFIEAVAGEDGMIGAQFTYRVTRREVKGETKTSEDKDKLARFLQPDALVPITGKPLELIKGKELPDDPMKKARLLYDVVNQHMKYSKEGKDWGRGDSEWACDSKYGNCSDFHSLFISLARSQKMPAKFEMGFPIPSKRGEGTVGGYHCWAFFQPEGKAWVPVDISEANKEPKLTDYYFGNLSEDRVGFTTGRDINLVPKQAGEAVNFFIYPYVEVDDKRYDQTKIATTFSYKDIKQGE